MDDSGEISKGLTKSFSRASTSSSERPDDPDGTSHPSLIRRTFKFYNFQHGGHRAAAYSTSNVEPAFGLQESSQDPLRTGPGLEGPYQIPVKLDSGETTDRRAVHSYSATTSTQGLPLSPTTSQQRVSLPSTSGRSHYGTTSTPRALGFTRRGTPKTLPDDRTLSDAVRCKGSENVHTGAKVADSNDRESKNRSTRVGAETHTESAGNHGFLGGHQGFDPPLVTGSISTPSRGTYAPTAQAPRSGGLCRKTEQPTTTGQRSPKISSPTVAAATTAKRQKSVSPATPTPAKKVKATVNESARGSENKSRQSSTAIQGQSTSSAFPQKLGTGIRRSSVSNPKKATPSTPASTLRADRTSLEGGLDLYREQSSIQSSIPRNSRWETDRDESPTPRPSNAQKPSNKGASAKKAETSKPSGSQSSRTPSAARAVGTSTPPNRNFAPLARYSTPGPSTNTASSQITPSNPNTSPPATLSTSASARQSYSGHKDRGMRIKLGERRPSGSSKTPKSLGDGSSSQGRRLYVSPESESSTNSSPLLTKPVITSSLDALPSTGSTALDPGPLLLSNPRPSGNASLRTHPLLEDVFVEPPQQRPNRATNRDRTTNITYSSSPHQQQDQDSRSNNPFYRELLQAGQTPEMIETMLFACAVDREEAEKAQHEAEADARKAKQANEQARREKVEETRAIEAQRIEREKRKAKDAKDRANREIQASPQRRLKTVRGDQSSTVAYQSVPVPVPVRKSWGMRSKGCSSTGEEETRDMHVKGEDGENGDEDGDDGDEDEEDKGHGMGSSSTGRKARKRR